MPSMCDAWYAALEEAVLFLTLPLLLHRSSSPATATKTTTRTASFGAQQPERHSSNARALTHLAIASRLRQFL